MDLLAFGGLALPLAALNLPFYVYLPTFYVTELGLDLATVGAVLLAARLLDVVTDPLVGTLGDRTRSRFGRRRPWMLGALPLLLVASFFLFLPREGAGGLYLFLWASVAFLAWTMLLLAYSAWGAELSTDYDERSRIFGAREGFVILGIILAAALPTLIGAGPGSATTMAAIFWSMALLLPLAFAVLLWRIGESAYAETRPLKFVAGLGVAFANRPFRRLVFAYLLNGVANGLPATLFLLYVQHVIEAPGASGPLLLVYFASGLVAIPAWLWLSYRIGKHRAWSLSMLWVCGVFALVPLLGAGDVWWFATVCVASGLGLGADLALPTAMQADVVDADSAVTGNRRAGLYFALWSMATKLSLALAVGIAFGTLDVAGFAAEGTSNGPIALLALVGLYALLPVAMKFASIFLVWNFEIDAARLGELRAEGMP
ncbi:MAG: MFS transporter [Geminicoccaceae bacterium]|jgi:Na+/melibiose symporter-like transporter|nr:MFS transporter [Geminicoccaceae bacterium]MCB9968624.1 MFS transporter [Geminicoccaceae bacterium]HRY23180.1 MFS transporter [Geminicoccaceae bacterium]